MEQVTGKHDLTKKQSNQVAFSVTSEGCTDLHPRPLSVLSLFHVETETLGFRFSGAERKELDI